MSVRPGEELDVAAVDRWLRSRVPGLEGASGLPEVTQYSGGASNWTYRLKYSDPLDFVLRRPPAGTKAKSAHDMTREYRVQKGLKPVFPSVPTMIGLEEDPAVIGAPFYVMDRIDGVIPRKSFPDGAADTVEKTRALCLAMIDKLIELHQVDVNAAGLSELGKGRGYPRRQIEGWSDRYEKARTWNVPKFSRVRAWLHDHIPDDVKSCVIHNDYRFDNLILDRRVPANIVGVLDWELSTVGCPLMDLGCVLSYWVESGDDFFARRTRRQPTHLPGMLKRREVAEYYLDKTGHKRRTSLFTRRTGCFVSRGSCSRSITAITTSRREIPRSRTCGSSSTTSTGAVGRSSALHDDRGVEIALVVLLSERRVLRKARRRTRQPCVHLDLALEREHFLRARMRHCGDDRAHLALDRGRRRPQMASRVVERSVESRSDVPDLVCEDREAFVGRRGEEEAWAQADLVEHRHAADRDLGLHMNPVLEARG
jgi:aminoglycoside phosphotransferase (APT) family kinase protein